MKRPDEKNYSYNAEIYESYSYCRDMVKYADALEAQIKALKKVTLGLPSVSKCSSCNGRGYFKNHFNMKVNCRRCYGTGNID